MTQPAQYISGRTVQEQMNELISYVDTRAAEVATDAIASDVAQVHQDMLDADADAQAAAASAAAAAGTLANAVKKTGESSQSIAGDIAVAGDLSAGGDVGVQGQLSVLGGCDLRAPVKIPVTPTNNDDAASKKYVDDSLAGYVPMVRTTGNQTIAGVKTFTSPQEGTWNGHRLTFSAASGGQWYKIGEITKLTSTYTYQVMTWCINSGYFNSSKGGIAFFALIIPNNGNIEGFLTGNKANDANIWANFSIKIGVKADGNMEVFAKGRDYTGYIFNPISIVAGANNIPAGDCITALTAAVVPEPQAADYTQLITVTI